MINRVFIKSALVLGVFILSIACTNGGKSNSSEAEIILKSIENQSRFFSTDQVAKRIIADDPSIILIDVRSLFDFEEYSLPTAICIPSEDILLEENKVHFEKEFQDIVLFSTDDIYADQAWYLLNKKGYKNIFIMKGGLNAWFSTIMMPEEPAQGSPEQEFDLYSFRKGASIYFGGSQPEIPAVEASVKKIEKPAPKKEVKVEKKVKKQAEGGC